MRYDNLIKYLLHCLANKAKNEGEGKGDVWVAELVRPLAGTADQFRFLWVGSETASLLEPVMMALLCYRE